MFEWTATPTHGIYDGNPAPPATPRPPRSAASRTTLPPPDSVAQPDQVGPGSSLPDSANQPDQTPYLLAAIAWIATYFVYLNYPKHFIVSLLAIAFIALCSKVEYFIYSGLGLGVLYIIFTKINLL